MEKQLQEASNIYFDEGEKLLNIMQFSLFSIEKDIEDYDSMHTFIVATQTFERISKMYEYTHSNLFVQTINGLLSMVYYRKITLNENIFKTLNYCYSKLHELIHERVDKDVDKAFS